MALTANDFLEMPRKELLRHLCEGYPIPPEALDDTEYRGVSLGLPGFIERMTWKTFKKVFHRDPAGHLRGWNVRMTQNGIDGPFTPMTTRAGGPRTFGHYRVVDCAGERVHKGADNGLLIHYGLGGNSLLDPMRRIRDPIVAVNQGSTELLLGWSYLDLGWFRVGTPSFFTLQRDCELTHRADPPRPPA